MRKPPVKVLAYAVTGIACAGVAALAYRSGRSAGARDSLRRVAQQFPDDGIVIATRASMCSPPKTDRLKWLLGVRLLETQTERSRFDEIRLILLQENDLDVVGGLAASRLGPAGAPRREVLERMASLLAYTGAHGDGPTCKAVVDVLDRYYVAAAPGVAGEKIGMQRRSALFRGILAFGSSVVLPPSYFEDLRKRSRVSNVDREVVSELGDDGLLERLRRLQANAAGDAPGDLVSLLEGKLRTRSD